MMDSGIGGLTVLKAAVRQMPAESIVYVGDTARMPYGPREPEEVLAFTRQIAQYLIKEHDIKALAIACNTATACALPALQAELAIPVIGVIDSGVQSAVLASKTRKIGVIATQGTVDSGQYQAEIKAAAPDSQVYAQAEPDFVQLVEQNRYQDADVPALVAKHLAPLKQAGIDTLVLGCTHFPLLAQSIQQALGPEVTLVDPGVATAEKLADFLAKNDLAQSEEATANYHLYTTGAVDTFSTIAEQWLGKEHDWHFSHLDLP
ncbi:glutamate racemase/Nucleoside-triphosphatase [Fructobacillus pseudoficulneus]|uniref:Glutamate racemase n=2 Tax=Fructobacillus pseudoficulneus TaxID=220714 RepID=A0A3F3GV61_9LACO|nr:glutamate racemase/Nucleoside-triphosphatase [Fructobacillus pseudoficulneus]